MPAVQEIKLDDLDAVKAVVEAVRGLAPQDQQRVFRWAAEKLGLAAARADTFEAAGEPARAAGEVDIRSFVDRKSPRSDVQFAATVAYFYRFEAAESQRQESITAEDLREACRRAGRKRLGNARNTLWNAVSVGVLDNVEKGRFAINSVGENLVAMTLPRNGGGGEGSVPAPARPKRRAARSARAAGRKAKKA